MAWSVRDVGRAQPFESYKKADTGVHDDKSRRSPSVDCIANLLDAAGEVVETARRRRLTERGCSSAGHTSTTVGVGRSRFDMLPDCMAGAPLKYMVLVSHRTRVMRTAAAAQAGETSTGRRAVG